MCVCVKVYDGRHAAGGGMAAHGAGNSTSAGMHRAGCCAVETLCDAHTSIAVCAMGLHVG